MDRYTHAQAKPLSESVNRLALPSAGGDPIATLPRPQLEALAVWLLALVGVLVARPVAPNGRRARGRVGTGGDWGRRTGG